MNSVSVPTLDHTVTDRYADLFDAMSDSTRLAILQHLAHGPHRVRDLVGHLGFAQSTVSTHLACLRDCGLVESRTEGRSSWFSLSEPQLLAAVWRAAEDVLAATGNRVALCPHLTHPHTHATTQEHE